ncbi:MAG: hypothetical protein M1840_007161 [Geoglossum simile]|nr:MAG: hypothetical protein M1840_007161 [Geoglossum simile]
MSDPHDNDLTASKQLQTLLCNHIHSCSLRQMMGTALCLYPAETSLRKQYERRMTSQEWQKHRTDGIVVSSREQAIEVWVRKEGSRRRAGAAITQYDYSTPKSYYRHYKPSHYYLSSKIYATVLHSGATWGHKIGPGPGLKLVSRSPAGLEPAISVTNAKAYDLQHFRYFSKRFL